MYCYECEISLALKPKFQKLKTQPLKDAWLSFADELTFEDVNERIDIFAVNAIGTLSFTALHSKKQIEILLFSRLNSMKSSDLSSFFSTTHSRFAQL